MIILKTSQEIEKLRIGGKRLADIVKQVAAMVHPGVTPIELNKYAEVLIAEKGDQASFLNYKPHGVKRAYPASICISVNDEVVHGIPTESSYVLKEGDIVSVDIGLIHEGMFTDHAITVPVGAVSEDARYLITQTHAALEAGIAAIRPGSHVGDIGAAIAARVPKKLGIVTELSGHGVGHAVHEDPFVPNKARAGEGPLLKPGMVIAIEPMLTLGSPEVVLAKDGYTYRTKDHSLAAHFEHTVLITETGAEVLTK